MIVLENINKTYHNGAPLHVLKGIDLEIEKGELVSIMGASGSGKSLEDEVYQKFLHHFMLVYIVHKP